MHHATPLITTIVGGLVLAFILGMLANKLRISPLVGYLLAGVLAGPFTPGFVADTKLAPELAELGVILLMFGVGLHFSLKDLMAVKAIAIPGAIAQIAVATLLGMALSAVLGWSLMTGIVFGLCLSTASTVVLLRALEERQLIDSQRGQIAIGWLIVEDLVMVLTLVLLPAVAGMMEQGDVGFATLAVDMGITIGKVIAFIAIMMLVGRRLVPWIMARSAATGSRELFTLSVLALALGIAFGAVELFDVSFALGAFFAGKDYVTAAAAFESSLICLIPMAVIKTLITQNNDLAFFFIKQLSFDLTVADERTVNLTQKHIRGRLAESLLFLKDSYGLEEDGSTLSIYLSREDLANLSNMTTSNAIRTLSQFATEKLIAIDGRKIKIIEEERLKKISKIG